MVKYSYVGDVLKIKDYQNAKTFSSFLPAIAGVDGKPLWAFYANVGQVIGGFGVNNKDTPITPFDSAHLAYQNIPLNSFRSFLKIDGKFFQPFFVGNEHQTLSIGASEVGIQEDLEQISYQVKYTSVPHQNYAGLVRLVEIKNNSSQDLEIELLDGLPVFFPHGLSNYCYKELVSLMKAYCQIDEFSNKTPFVKFKTSTEDASQVSQTYKGNGYFSLDNENHILDVVVDIDKVFGLDHSLITPRNFLKYQSKEFLALDEQLENKLPCAFTYVKKVLKADETYAFISLYGMFDNVDIFHQCIKEASFNSLKGTFKANVDLIASLCAPLEIHSANEMFDAYMKQTFLDNNLRGGFPTKLGKSSQVYYIYGRKHGDMERDYNSFQIPSQYYSSGLGNFRDVNQNRRSDLYYYPYVGDYNIKLFFNLIQLDGQNPLSVKPLSFKVDQPLDLDQYHLDENIHQYLSHIDTFYPSNLYTYLKDHHVANYEDIFNDFLNHASQHLEASFAEGYWVDHWTYNVDLLENYASVYPDKIKDLLLDDSYLYFYSYVYVEPRDEKYCYIDENTIRQYGAIDLNKAKLKAKEHHHDLNETLYLEDVNHHRVSTTLLGKIISLILNKFVTLDSLQTGVEMECEKPGWNDAMNGLPGLFASGVSESVELVRLMKFLSTYLPLVKGHDIVVLREVKELFTSINGLLNDLLANKITAFEYWDKQSTLRETFRKKIEFNVEGTYDVIAYDELACFLEKGENLIVENLKKAKTLNQGILPSYLIYHVEKYHKLNKINHLGYQVVKVDEFSLVNIPFFLEASARSLKLEGDIFTKEEYQKIKNSGLYDQKLGLYKTSADLTNSTFEIGRVHAFTSGWLERECDFLHMSYKYLLGLLRHGLYEEFYHDLKTNVPCFMDINVYGRSILENSSFIVPSNNPDSSKHGQGFFARLTGANAEMLNMLNIMEFGEQIFTYDGERLHLNLQPKLSKEMFKDHLFTFKIFGNTTITYENKANLDLYLNQYHLEYVIDGNTQEEIDEKTLLKMRNQEKVELYVRVIPNEK